jgi:hypothetical protein
MPVHHLMIGTWTPPGAIFTVAFDDDKLTLELVKRTEIPHDEPISWMAFDVSTRQGVHPPSMMQVLTFGSACEEKHLWLGHEEMVQLRRKVAD